MKMIIKASHWQLIHQAQLLNLYEPVKYFSLVVDALLLADKGTATCQSAVTNTPRGSPSSPAYLHLQPGGLAHPATQIKALERESASGLLQVINGTRGSAASSSVVFIIDAWEIRALPLQCRWEIMCTSYYLSVRRSGLQLPNILLTVTNKRQLERDLCRQNYSTFIICFLQAWNGCFYCGELSLSDTERDRRMEEA